MQNFNQFIQHLESKTQQSLKSCRFTAIGGGDINRAYYLSTESVSWFIKINQPDLLAMFEAEAKGLQELANNNMLRIPKVITNGRTEHYAYLILEYIALKPLDAASERLLGQQLAALHRQRQPFYGWFRNNTIGSTFQDNSQSADWVVFWQQQRLGKQLKFAADNGYTGNLQCRGEKLLAKVGAFFTDYQPHPALLHGDLWAGNAATDEQGQPVVFDPACYYGDREADIAMTELFGGFGTQFYSAYQAEYPLDAGYQVRRTLYNLYHILNHLNLFGGSYLRQAESMIDKLLAEVV
jgi:fructosamine-3-kinase